MKKDNKGFSLLEFIIVFGMAAILAGSAVSFTGYLRFANSKGCAEKLYSGIDKLQVSSMAKKEKKLMIVWREDDVFYYDVYSYDGSTVSGNTAKTNCKDNCIGGSTATKIGNSAVAVKYKTSSGSTIETLDNNEFFYIGYAMDGSFSSTYTDVEEIYVESANGDGMTYTIKLIEETGKHFLN